MTVTWKEEASAVAIPQQQHYPEDGSVFPMVMTPNAPKTAKEAVEWAKRNQASLAQELKKQGAILFRGFQLKSAEDFSDFVEALGAEPLPYIGGAAPRYTVYKDVHTTNESPPDQPIPFHLPSYPEHIFFFCHVAPTQGGETPLVRSDILYERVNKQAPEFTQKLESEGVVYTRIIPEEDDNTSAVGRGWKSTFNPDKQTAIQVAKGLNVSLEWLPNGDVKTVSPVLPAVKIPHKLERKVWFNSVIASYTGCVDSRNDPKKAVCYGNGDYMDQEHMDLAVKVAREASAAVPYQEGDVYWIDNNQVLHSRNFFTPPRKVYAYLGKNKPY
ncbi:hypothetical protein EDD86DRAFT_250433 [Gorgonomyces haynaldii]|nr:hypothetical protein EDD86DRAFT_250433 [Gorgonomyces haynaldii]